MLINDFISIIKQKLSGGNAVEVEIQDAALRTIINDAFDKAKPWFFNKEIYETVRMTLVEGDSGYIPFSVLLYTPQHVVAIYTTLQTGMGSFDNDLAGLLSLEGRHIISQNLINGAMSLQFERQADTFLNTTLKHVIIGDKIMASGAIIGDNVTVRYVPEVLSFESVTNLKALDWIKDYAFAQTKVSLGYVRAKWRGGDLEVENDGQDLISQGTAESERLLEKLQDLGF